MRGEKGFGGARLGKSRWSSASRGSESDSVGSASDEEIRAATIIGWDGDAACVWAKMQIGQSESSAQQPSEQSNRQPRGPTMNVKPIPSSATNRRNTDWRANQGRKGCRREVI